MHRAVRILQAWRASDGRWLPAPGQGEEPMLLGSGRSCPALQRAPCSHQHSVPTALGDLRIGLAHRERRKG